MMKHGPYTLTWEEPVKRDVYVRDLSLFTQMFALLMQLMQLMQLMMRNDLSA